jgi:hypothetical protein
VVVALSAVLVFSLVLGGGLYLRCGFQCDRYGLPVGPVTELNLKAHPEATLYYPNSKVLWSQASPEQRDAGSGAGRASLDTNLEATGRGQTPSDMQAIRDWYSAYLKGHGWLATGQPGFESFVRGPRETFAVNFNVVSDPSGASGSSSGWLRYSIEYSIVTCAYLQYWHRDLAC